MGAKQKHAAKKKSPEKSPKKTATIVSMFKKQTERQARLSQEVAMESGSEADVVITDVVGLEQAVIKPQLPHSETSLDKGKKLSLSSRKRKIGSKGSVDSDASDSDFDRRKRGKKSSRPQEMKFQSSYQKLLKSKSENTCSTKQHSSPYKLRKRKTVPLIEVSDSDSESCETFRKAKTEVAMNEEELSVPNGNINTEEIDSKHSTEVEMGCSKSKYFKEIRADAHSSKPKKRNLSLKKSKLNLASAETERAEDKANLFASNFERTQEKTDLPAGADVLRIQGDAEVTNVSLQQRAVSEEDQTVIKFSKYSKQKKSRISVSGKTVNDDFGLVANSKEKNLVTDNNAGRPKLTESCSIDDIDVAQSNSKEENTVKNSTVFDMTGEGEDDIDVAQSNSKEKNTVKNSPDFDMTGEGEDTNTTSVVNNTNCEMTVEEDGMNTAALMNSTDAGVTAEGGDTNTVDCDLTADEEGTNTATVVNSTDCDMTAEGGDTNTVDCDMTADKEGTNTATVVNSTDCDMTAEGGDGNATTVVASSSETEAFRVPYYLENFKTIIKSVLEDEENSRLFDESDKVFVELFNEISEPCQKLYVRLFSRKLAWLPLTKLNYPEIADDIEQLIDILTDNGFLLAGDDLHDLPTVLKILPAADLKALAKSFHINGTGLTKPRIIEQLMKKGQQNSISMMFKGGSTGNMEKTIIRRAKIYVGKVCRLNEEPRAVFIRMLMLFSLYNTNLDEDSGGGGQNYLFQMLMVNIGKVVYPSYTVIRKQQIFKDRAALVRFGTALQFELDIQAKTERGKWPEAYEIYKQAKEVGKHVCLNKHYQSWDKDLPQFLRFYTAGSVYTRIDSLGVEILQRLKLYRDAVQLLEELLAQDVYCEHYRGHWYERLAINLEAHLKETEKSLAVITKGLCDPTVRVGRRLALYERGRRICEAPKSKYAERMVELKHYPVQPTPEVTIEGMVISDATSVGMRYQFVMHGDTDSVTLCAVEEFVLDYYSQNGYPEGLHAEGSVVSNLFVLFFWDILFMEVQDAFQGPFQSCPLDIATRDFYLNRKEHVDERLEWLKNASVEELQEEVGHIWEQHEGKMVAGIGWEKFSVPDTHQRLVGCMGGAVIAGILDRYVKDPRHTRSGFPDLTLWNADTKQLKICEVKGPNDKLSHKQILWIDYLLKLGVDAEVCYVKAVGSKKLKPAEKS